MNSIFTPSHRPSSPTRLATSLTPPLRSAAPTGALDATTLTRTAAGTAATAIASPPAPPTSPVDPWPALERAGLLGGANAVSGPIGAALTTATRTGLLDALRRIEANGVTFEMQRGFHVPGLQSKYVAMSAEDLAEALEEQPSEFKTQLNVNIGDNAHIHLQNLDDIRLLDAYRGAGPAACPNRAAAVEAVRSLESNGIGFGAYNYSGAYDTNAPVMGGGLATLMALVHKGSAYISDPPGSDQQRRLETDADLLAHDFFRGSGIDRGLPEGALAVTVRDADKAGCGFINPDYSSVELFPPLDAWKKLRGGATLLYGPKGGVKVSVTSAQMADLSKVAPRLAQAADIAARFAIPALANTPLAEYGQDFVSAVLDSTAPQPVEAKAELLARLVRAQFTNGRDASRYTLERATKDMSNLLAIEPDATALTSLGTLYAAAVSEDKGDDALAIVKQARHQIAVRAGSPAEKTRLDGQLVKLAEATRSLSAALEGVELLRIPAGSESSDAREKLFLDIARAETTGTGALAASDYRALLVNRLPSESLIDAGNRFLALQGVLATAGQQPRTAEVFAFVQQGTREGRFGALSANDAMRRISENLALSRSLDDAMAALTAPSAGVPAGDATVKNGDDCVIIGGVRVPKGTTR